MELPRIKALDLRDREVAHEIDNYGVFWDWPKFPVDTLTFINTGIRPTGSRKVIVNIRADVTALKRALAKVEIATWQSLYTMSAFGVQLAKFRFNSKPKRVARLEEWVSHRGW